MKKIGKYDSTRVEEYLELFKKENEIIRNELASIVPAYNELINMRAMSFEEFALQSTAIKQGIHYEDPLFKYETIVPDCPFCGSSEKVRRIKNKGLYYACAGCNRRFSANYNSISSDTSVSALVWLKILHCLLNHQTIEKTKEYCGISSNTYYAIRNKLFYAMQLMMDEVKLYGKIQCDNTFVKTSFKGLDLSDSEYPEDSIFYDTSTKPREAKQRGGPNSSKSQVRESICIFCAIDDRGHVFSRYVGIGMASIKLLKYSLKSDKILLAVPDSDPFLLQKKYKEPTTRPNDSTLLIADGERAIHSYAEQNNIPVEYHVYRKNGKQIKHGKNDNDIQTVNNLHYRLKKFLRDSNYVSSKYLPGYLVMFEFIINTGATQESIGELFRILAKPGLGQPADYYGNLYTVPEYYYQSKQLGYDLPPNTSVNQLRAAYLYHKRLEAINSGEKSSKVAEIADELGCTPATVRRQYNNLNNAGFLPNIIKFFENENSEQKIRRNSVTTPIPSEVYAFFNEYNIEKSKPRDEQMPFQEFYDYVNKKLGIDFYSTKFSYWKKKHPELVQLPKKKPDYLTNREKRILDIHIWVENEILELRREGVVNTKNKISEILAKYANLNNIDYTTVYNLHRDCFRVKSKHPELYEQYMKEHLK